MAPLFVEAQLLQAQKEYQFFYSQKSLIYHFRNRYSNTIIFLFFRTLIRALIYYLKHGIIH
ncbi:hypothetical protein Hanom_Chr08g00738321 [Helianthus anomalus]